MEPNYIVYPIGSKTEYLKLRDTFAAAALTGIIAHQTQDYGMEAVKDRAEWAYEHADAMLAARLKKE